MVKKSAKKIFAINLRALFHLKPPAKRFVFAPKCKTALYAPRRFVNFVGFITVVMLARILYIMKICVYAIAKNEEMFVERWAQSMREADEIVVLDTGSTDETVNKLVDCGVKVKVKRHSFFRFDIARNESLSLIPPDTDICVCTDLDEVFERGWREKLERAWSCGTTRLRYRYVWSHLSNGADGVQFYGEKIHAYGAYSWVYPVHEVLRFDNDFALPEKTVTADNLVLHHYPNERKSRSNYLPLLQLSARENPLCDRTAHYLGREYMFHHRYDDAISALKRHLSLKSATWVEERIASMRYIARCYEHKGDYISAERWFLTAVSQSVPSREAWVDYANFLFCLKDYDGVIFACSRALTITEKRLNYITDPVAWGERVFDLLSLAYYFVGDYQKAVQNGEIALSICPDDRIKTNLFYFNRALKNSE